MIDYKKGKENKVEDALSRKFEDSSEEDMFSISLISFSCPTCVEELKAYYLLDMDSKDLLLKMQ